MGNVEVLEVLEVEEGLDDSRRMTRWPRPGARVSTAEIMPALLSGSGEPDVWS